MRPFPWGPLPGKVWWVTHDNGTARFTQHPGFYPKHLGYTLTEMIPKPEEAYTDFPDGGNAR